VTRLRCAIYTRKSTEEGLDQAFNSLDAQREACEAYVRSQKAEGWELQAAAYDDGGWSGGTMDRPGLRRLLEDEFRSQAAASGAPKFDHLPTLGLALEILPRGDAGRLTEHTDEIAGRAK